MYKRQPIPTINAVGVASPKAHGQAMTRTETADKIPVSYTHLDVYKRQALTSDDPSVAPYHGVNYYLALQKNKVPATLHVYPTGGQDVYKRQDLSKPYQPPFQPSVAHYTDNYVLLISGSKAFSYAGQRIGAVSYTHLKPPTYTQGNLFFLLSYSSLFNYINK